MPFSIRPFRRVPVQYAVMYHTRLFRTLPLTCASGFWLLITLLALGSGPAYAEWIPVEKNNQLAGIMTVYIDPDTIHRNGNLVTMWQLIDFKTMQGGRSPSRFSSTKIQKQFDCAEKRFRLVALTDFWGNMGTGEPAGAYVDGGYWIPVEPDSIDQSLWKVVCGEQ